jgi:phospholipid/cholesterol/gamma-HCH transport system ATP-binding protein
VFHRDLLLDAGGVAVDQPIISVRDLTVRYEDRCVLDHVDLDVARGEVMVLLGGSGSGKTTLLRHVIGLERPHQGTIVVKGIDINRCSARELTAVRRTMGVAFQEAALFNSLSIAENVALPLRELTTLADPVIEIMIYLKLASVGLGEVEKLLPRELSGGMKKRAAVARATALDPEILVFDEPSAGLDPIVAAELDELILLLKNLFHMTLVVVTHELASAFRIADRIAMLYNGSLIAVDVKDAFRSSTDPRVRQFLDRIPVASSTTRLSRATSASSLVSAGCSDEEHGSPGRRVRAGQCGNPRCDGVRHRQLAAAWCARVVPDVPALCRRARAGHLRPLRWNCRRPGDARRAGRIGSDAD